MMRRSLELATVVALLIAGMGSLAEATSPVRTRGAPGKVDLYVVQGWWTDHGSTLRVNGPKVHRTTGGRSRWRRARGTQRICVSYDVYKFEGAYYEVPWRHYAGERRCGSAQPGYLLPFQDIDFAVTGYNSYSVNVGVSWRRSRDGKFIGSRLWDYDLTADYQCMTQKCDTFYGYENVAAIFFEGSI
jgi:hypothetical protein